jgi:hypothetical protein
MVSLLLMSLVGAGEPAPVLGLKIGAEEREVRAKLAKLGKASEEKEEREEEEGETVVWTMNSGDFKSVVVRFADDRLRSLTAFVRPGASVPFESLGDPKGAAVLKPHSAIWNVEAKPWPYRLVAKGPNGRATVIYMISLHREKLR